MNYTASTKSRSEVTPNNDLTITIWADGSLPEVYSADILQEAKSIDGTSGIEGDLILGMDDGADAALEGVDLVLNVSEGEADKYTKPEADLLYDATDTPDLNNVLHERGDTLTVVAAVGVSGSITLSSFTDTVTGGTAGLARLFRVSPDGVFYTEWADLTDENLAAMKAQVAEGSLTVEVQYILTGAEPVTWERIEFTGACVPIEFVAPTINESIFSSVANTADTKRIEQNLFKKLYFRGITPEYVERGANRDLEEDRDFVSLFTTVGRYFAMMISFAKRFEHIYTDFPMLREYVRQIGLYFDEKTVTIEELQYLASHYYDEIRKRGTAMIFARKGQKFITGYDSNGDPVYTEQPWNGEFVRLFGIEDTDELLHDQLPVQRMGWCLGQCSPMYCGTGESNQLNKTREDVPDFESLDDFVTTGNVSLTTVDGRGCLKVVGEGGLGRGDTTTDVTENMYNADCNLSYEVTFWMKTNGKGTLNFGVEAFSEFKNLLFNGFIRLDATRVTNMFVEGLPLDTLVPDTWYHVRGIIHAYNTANVQSGGINIAPHYGTELCFNNYATSWFLPKVQLAGDDETAELLLWDYKIRPLVFGRNILPLKETGVVDARSNGFLQSNQLFYIFLKNNNNSISQRELEEIVNRYLIPYNYQPVFIYGTTPVNAVSVPTEFLPYLYLTPETAEIPTMGDEVKIQMKTNTNKIKLE